MAESSQIPEPPEGRFVIAGEEGIEEVFRRADPLGEPDPWRWWPLRGIDEGDPVTWHGVCHTEHVGPEGTTYKPRPVEELVRRSQVDRLVAEAVADGGYERVGDHRIALSSGRCLTHGEVYEVPHELDRLRQRHAEEADSAH